MLRTVRTLGLTAICLLTLGAIVHGQVLSIRAKPSTKQSKTDQTKERIAVFPLYSQILEAPVSDDPLFGARGAEPLKDLIARLEKARDDKLIPAVAVVLGGSTMGAAQLEELHATLRSIRDAGKPVYIFADNLSFGALSLASAGSRISVTPIGDVITLGLYGEQMYLRGLLDKIHVTPDFQTSGAYKSAGEMFMRTKPSPEAAEMYDWLFDSLFDSFVQRIADGRGKSVSEVKGWLDEGVRTAEQAQKRGMIDAVEDRSDFVAFMRKKHGEDLPLDTSYGKDSKGELDLSNPFAFLQVWSEMLQKSSKSTDKDAIAIVFVEGPIVTGRPEPSPFESGQGTAYSDPIRQALDKAAKDDAVKAVVLRVDSPGGSAVASEIILEATKRVAAKKPFVVSMGNVAGSGGYYVSCGTDTIFADASTITASIGVVTGKLATRQMWDSVGINWHPIARGKNSGMFASADMFTGQQKEMMQEFMDEIYDVFKGHVMKARGNRLKKPIDELAGGRVFTGKQAYELGLVDRIGTLRDALDFVADKANLKRGEYEIRVIPPPRNLVEQLLDDLTGNKGEEGTISEPGRRPWSTHAVVDAAMPLLRQMQPHRAAALQRGLIQLETLQRESIILMTPEFLFEHN